MQIPSKHNLKKIKRLGAQTDQSCHKTTSVLAALQEDKQNNWRNLSSKNVVIQKVKLSWGTLSKDRFPLLNHYQTQQIFQKFHQG